MSPTTETTTLLPYTPRFKKLLSIAQKVSREFGHNYVGSEHLLMALFQIEDGLGKIMLVASGADQQKAVKALLDWHRSPNENLQAQIEELRARVAAMEAKNAPPTEPTTTP